MAGAANDSDVSAREAASALSPPSAYRDNQYIAAREALARPASPVGGLLLVATLVLFALSLSGSSTSAATIAVTIGVLLLHESGHYAGMRIFGYRDVKMFFIPFLGAAVSGKQGGVAAWKEATVVLLGPTPGIVLGGILAARMPAPGSLLRDLVMQLLIINGLNLLPLGGLDGGRLVQRVLFSRHRHLEVAFQVLAGVALLVLAVRFSMWALAAFAYLGLISVHYQHRVLRAASALRGRLPGDIDALSLDDEKGHALFVAARDVVGERSWERPRVVATAMENVLTAMRPAPGFGATAALLVAWAGGLVGAVGATLYVLVAGPPSHWETRSLTQAGFTVSMPYSPKSFVPADLDWDARGVEGLASATRRRTYEIAAWSIGDEDGHDEIIDALSSVARGKDDVDARDRHPVPIQRAGLTGREEQLRFRGLICRVQMLAGEAHALRLSACATRLEPQMDQFFASLRRVDTAGSAASP
jgi:Zn-dependent protease